ncbi:hypothetical protein AZE42_10315 [Rhizopogon vesiculosus]|uniref:Uncharacterized protein n=1 Tax=Rhizopogon vesiculosus TaxID=180088 RepID=A0A1J8QDY8_9AGAM|nr:hypothetical protein AZE42_10315 [Rhizopogon vesiculosus]
MAKLRKINVLYLDTALQSKILIVDMIAFPNVDVTATMTIKSPSHERVDNTIPSHFGSASKIISGSSMHMLAMINGYERPMLRAEQSLVVLLNINDVLDSMTGRHL